MTARWTTSPLRIGPTWARPRTWWSQEAVNAECLCSAAEAVLFNAEEIHMRCRDAEVIFDASVYFEEDPNLAPIVSQ